MPRWAVYSPRQVFQRSMIVAIESLLDPPPGTYFLSLALRMPGPAGWDQLLVGRPRAERLPAHRQRELVAVHADVAGARRYRPCLLARTAAQERGIITADAVDDLADLIECH